MATNSSTRNDPCPCGSGVKFKNCCGKVAAARRSAKTLGWPWLLAGVVLGGVLVFALVYDPHAGVQVSDTDRGPGWVWSEEHGHFHRTDEVADQPTKSLELALERGEEALAADGDGGDAGGADDTGGPAAAGGAGAGGAGKAGDAGATDAPAEPATPSPEEEERASDLYREARVLAGRDQVVEAREKLALIDAELGETRAARRARRFAKELSVVGKEALMPEVDEWFLGSEEDVDLDEGATLLVFWEEWCPHCKREAPKMQELATKHEERLDVLGLTRVTKSSTPEKVRAFLDEKDIEYPIAKVGYEPSRHYAVSGIPAAALVRDGKIVWRGHPASLSDERLEALIGPDAPEPPAPPEQVAEAKPPAAAKGATAEADAAKAKAAKDAAAERDQEAGRLYREARAALKENRVVDARQLVSTLLEEHGSSSAARRARRMKNELAVVGKDAMTPEWEDWFVGGEEDVDLESGATLLVFWEIWCPHCKREAPKMQELAERWDGRLDVVGLTRLTKSATEEKVRAFLEEKEIEYPVAKVGAEPSSHYGVSGIPAAALVRDDKIVWRGHPATLSDELIAALLAPGAPVPPPAPVDVAAQEAEKAEEEARALYSRASTAARKDRIEEARTLLDELLKEHAESRVARSAKRLQRELSVIGKEAAAPDVEEWFVGSEADVDLEHGATLVVFWEEWCPHCKREAPKMQELADKHRGRLDVLGLTRVSRSSTPEKVRSFIETKGIRYPIAKVGPDASREYAVSGIPAAALVKDGRIVWRGHPGRLSEDVLDRLLS